jgi:hypothetical protein
MIDSQVMALITNSLEPQMSETFYNETALEPWQAIETQFSNKNSHSQIYQLKKEITQIQQETREVSELIGFVRAKYEELKLYIPPTIDLNVLQEREETDRVYTFLAALDSSYEPIRAQILLSTEKLSFDSVTALVRQEATDSNPKPEAHAFSAQHFSVGKGKGKCEVVRCSHCKQEGHTQEKCWILHPHLRPKRNQTEAAWRKFFPKNLDGGEEKRGMVSIKGDTEEAKSSQSEGERLDRL